MGNPEETLAAADVDTATIAAEPAATIAAKPAATTDPTTEDLTGALVGWKRKVRDRRNPRAVFVSCGMLRLFNLRF